VVLRTDLSGDPTFRQLLWRVREVVLGAFEHQDLPFEKMIDNLVSNQNPAPSPSLQISFNMLNVPHHALKLPGLTVEDLYPSETKAQYDLALYIREQQNRILLRLIYNTDLFDAATIVRLLRDLQTSLHGIVDNLEQPISGLPFYTETEAEDNQRWLKWTETKDSAHGLHRGLSTVDEDYEEITL
jgi:non-ribosomal peptide synthetase component F